MQQLDFLTVVTCRQPKRRTDPVRARMLRKEARLDALRWPLAPPCATLADYLSGPHGNNIAAIDETLMASANARRWLHACVAAGLVEKRTEYFPYRMVRFYPTARW